MKVPVSVKRHRVRKWDIKTKATQFGATHKQGQPGAKLARKVKEQKLTLCHQHGIVGVAIRNMTQQKDLARLANQ